MANEDDHTAQAVANSMFAADISKKMQVPDRITVSGGGGQSAGTAGSPTRGSTGGFRQPSLPAWANAADNERPGAKMQVPDRILLAGNNAHVAARSTPRELQLENSVLPTSPDHVSRTCLSLGPDTIFSDSLSNRSIIKHSQAFFPHFSEYQQILKYSKP